MYSVGLQYLYKPCEHMEAFAPFVLLGGMKPPHVCSCGQQSYKPCEHMEVFAHCMFLPCMDHGKAS